MEGWQRALRDDPVPWLLDRDAPAVRHLALRQLLGLPPDDPEVASARAAAMGSEPIAGILAAQDPQGWWVKPGPGYAPKYTGTVWQLIFLGQMGADGRDARVASACEYVLSHSQTALGGFGASSVRTAAQPPPSTAIHCLNGNLLRALIGFGWLDDPRVVRSIDWQVAVITGEGSGAARRPATSGPGFRCAANEHLPCAWGATKVVLGLAAIPAERRAPGVRRALDAGVECLLGCDPSTAAYPMPSRASRPNGSWFRPGFPSGYVADVLQVIEAVCDAGAAGDPRLEPAMEWLLGLQDDRGRWANRYAYQGKLVRDIDVPDAPSRWVTLRACRVLRAVAEAQGATVTGAREAQGATVTGAREARNA